MIVLGLDPGMATGWALYDCAHRHCIAVGEFPGHSIPSDLAARSRLCVNVIERLRPHGASYPQVVEAAYVCGRLVGMLGNEQRPVHELRRDDVRRELQVATHGAIQVADDATVWAALRLLHGDGCTKQGGALHLLKPSETGHARAAVAVAVAWCIRERLFVPAGAA